MLTMQAFYDRLFDEQKTGPGDRYLEYLRLLARLSLEQLLALESDLAWDPWLSDGRVGT